MAERLTSPFPISLSLHSILNFDADQSTRRTGVEVYAATLKSPQQAKTGS